MRLAAYDALGLWHHLVGMERLNNTPQMEMTRTWW